MEERGLFSSLGIHEPSERPSSHTERSGHGLQTRCFQYCPLPSSLGFGGASSVECGPEWTRGPGSAGSGSGLRLAFCVCLSCQGGDSVPGGRELGMGTAFSSHSQLCFCETPASPGKGLAAPPWWIPSLPRMIGVGGETATAVAEVESGWRAGGLRKQCPSRGEAR